MIQVILAGVENWLHDLPITFPNITNIPNWSISDLDPILPILQEAFDAQTRLGWDNFLSGQLHRSWLTAHDYYCDLRHLPSRNFYQVTAPRFIKQILIPSLQIWKTRNEFYHGANFDENLEIRTHDANTQVEAQYVAQHCFSNSDKDLLFLLNLPELLAKPLQYKQNWLELCDSCLTPPEPMTLHDEDILPPTASLHPYFQLPNNP